MERGVMVMVPEVSRPELEIIRRETGCAGIPERVILAAGDDGVGEEEIMKFCGEKRDESVLFRGDDDGRSHPHR